MKEAVGNAEAVKSFRHYGWGAHKLSDVMGSRFTDKKPCDIIACSPKGRHVMVEGKMIKKWSCFNDRVFAQHQIDELDNNCQKRQGRSFIFLYVRINGDAGKGTKRVIKLVVFDWKKHRKNLKGKGYSIEQMRSMTVGTWLDPLHDKHGKIIWPIKKLLKFN